MALARECPYCGSKATIRAKLDMAGSRFEFSMGNRYGSQVVSLLVIVCPSAECGEYALSATLHDHELVDGVWQDLPPKNKWHLLPFSSAKIFPAYIPEALKQDYEEACKIVGLSPKASATLSRRCLQGMVRDFWNVSGKTLYEEIDKIKGEVEPDTWEAIDSLRKLGNIGAHMEKDISLIIEVDQDEAELLISLIETLFAEWYVRRHDRQQRMAKIKAVAAQKDAERKEKV